MDRTDMSAPTRVLIADDDESVLQGLSTILDAGGEYQIRTAASGRQAWELLRTGEIDVALVDLMFEDVNGIALLERVRAQGLDTEIILITGHGSIDTAVEAMRKGAYDYLTKPVEAREVQRVLAHAAEKLRLAREKRGLQQQLSFLSPFRDLIGKSRPMQEVFKTIRAVAPTDASVLITGESGTGKELVARAIHAESRRAHGPFIAINCAALPATILESELFGHVRGAFTGAHRDHTGVFEQAHGGTLLLDEITELPVELQAKLLRVLETRGFRRVGGQREIQVDVRVLAATNREPRRAIETNRLREDLYYRLAVMEIRLPALRERREDIPLLAMAFLQQVSETLRRTFSGFEPEALQALIQYPWPGNVRELRNAVERAAILAPGPSIRLQDLPETLRSSVPALPVDADHDLIIPVGTPVQEAERWLILKTLEACNNNKTRAARLLGISLKTLHNKLARYREGH